MVYFIWPNIPKVLCGCTLYGLIYLRYYAAYSIWPDITKVLCGVLYMA